LLFLLSITAVSVTVNPPPAEARPRPGGGGGLSSFSANKTFGFGIMIGEPIGLSAKYYLSASTALDFAFGEYDRFREDDDLGVHMDFLWHPVVLATADPFIVPLYFGVGGRLVGDDDDGRDNDDDIDFGIRVPVGVMLDFNRVPIDIFFELAMIVEIVDEDDDDDVDLDAALGARYYF
jgi:hypothetical protein